MKLKYITFKLIRNFSKICSEKSYKIENIKKKNTAPEYFITFFYPSRRQLFIMSTIEIFENDSLISKFSSLDATKIGFYAAMSYQNIYAQKLEECEDVTI